MSSLAQTGSDLKTIPNAMQITKTKIVCFMFNLTMRIYRLILMLEFWACFYTFNTRDAKPLYTMTVILLSYIEIIGIVLIFNTFQSLLLDQRLPSSKLSHIEAMLLGL